VRMQSSLHARTLLEAAAIRVCNLEKLDSISDLIGSLAKSGTAPTKSGPAPSGRPRVPMRQVQSQSKKKETPRLTEDGSTDLNVASADLASARESTPAKSSNQEIGDGTVSGDGSPIPETPVTAASLGAATTTLAVGSVVDQSTSKAKVTAENIESVWKEVIAQMPPITGGYASDYESLELPQPDQLVVTLNQKFNSDMCSRADKKHKFEAALQALAGTSIRINFLASRKSLDQQKLAPKLTRQQQIRKLHDEDFVKKAISLFDAEITGYEEPVRTRKV